MNWRGAFSKESAIDLLAHEFTKEFSKLISVIVLERGFTYIPLCTRVP